jgi:hypothetical protein
MPTNTKKIRLNNKFYSRESIAATADAFSSIAVFEVREKEDSYEVTLLETRGQNNPDETLKEFANHCLANQR